MMFDRVFTDFVMLGDLPIGIPRHHGRDNRLVLPSLFNPFGGPCPAVARAGPPTLRVAPAVNRSLSAHQRMLEASYTVWINRLLPKGRVADNPPGTAIFT
jgi:hypothetical protein